MSIRLMCKLLLGTEVLDDHCTCSFSSISRNPPVTGVIEGEGTITILTMFPAALKGNKPRQFTLWFDAAFVPHVGKLERLPIILVPDDLVGHSKAAFRIGKI